MTGMVGAMLPSTMERACDVRVRVRGRGRVGVEVRVRVRVWVKNKGWVDVSVRFRVRGSEGEGLQRKPYRCGRRGDALERIEGILLELCHLWWVCVGVWLGVGVGGGRGRWGRAKMGVRGG